MPEPANLSVREIFEQAVEQPPESWPAFVQTACEGNAALQAQVERLLDAHLHAGSFMGRPVAGVATLASQPHLVGEAIGPYKLLEQLGEGGMGVVYVAEQREPIERRVALKIIKPGMDSRQVIARFEAERQTLALMDHPHIAKVFDGGTTDAGRLYFVMELVTGRPITHHCDEHQLSTRQRLELFLQVCQAIQHAHQKGIIHRDIKPNNILVTPRDGRAEIKVIDFGIAKATGRLLTEKTLFTEFGAVVGTLEYMSPEQTELANPDIDTRSDIYSLGVLLYELLTGTTPLSRERLRRAVFTDILRMVREEDPPTPSSRLSELGRSKGSRLPSRPSADGVSATGLPETEDPSRQVSTSHCSPASISAQRQSAPAKLTKVVRGELDWIVMKALEKDRNRRYETASSFALDVQRYLDDQPVLACPPSAAYRWRKFARRHKAAIATSALVAASLLIGTGVSIWQAVEADQARRLADQRLASETRALSEERRAKEVAEERRQQAEAAAELLRSVFEGLNPRSRLGQPAGELKDRLIARLDEAAARLEKEASDALTQARLQSSLGEAYLGLGETGKAITQLQRAVAKREARLGVDHPDTLDTVDSLAVAYLYAGQHKLALPLAQQNFDKRQASLGTHDPHLINSMTALAGAQQAAGRLDLALPLRKEIFERRKSSLGPENHSTLASMSNLAMTYRDTGNHKLALSLMEEVVKRSEKVHGFDHVETLDAMHNLAATYLEAGRLDLGLPLCERTFEKRTAILGPSHPDTLYSLHNMAVAHSARGEDEAAVRLMEQAVEKRTARLGSEHPDTLYSLHNLAVLYQNAGQKEAGQRLMEQAVKRREAGLGANHRDTLRSRHQLAEMIENAGQADLARQQFEQILERRKASLGPDDTDTLGSMNYLAYIHREAGNFELALPLFKQQFELTKAKLGPKDPESLSNMEKLASAYLEAGQPEPALTLLEQRLETLRAQHGSDNQTVRNSMVYLAGAYRDLGKYDKATPLYRELYEQYTRLSPGSSATTNALANLGHSLVRQQAYAEAEPLLRLCLSIREKREAKYWTLYNAKSLLGGLLLGQKKYAEAEPLLLAGYQGMQEREEDIPEYHQFRLIETLEWLVELYETQGQREQAGAWREKLKARQE